MLNYKILHSNRENVKILSGNQKRRKLNYFCGNSVIWQEKNIEFYRILCKFHIFFSPKCEGVKKKIHDYYEFSVIY